ncbi:MAG: hypothetical protein J4N98_09175 [Chloroflexi bacterium]|nr:hypothetical protein [Chloroflexota bacterium]
MFATLSQFLNRLHTGQRGQMLIIGIMFMGVIAGAAAIAVDTGSYMSHRRSLQNAADAIALAASQGLPQTGDALGLANDWAELNGIEPEEMNVTFTQQILPGEVNPKVTVDLTVGHNLTFMSVLGMDSAEISVTAAAVRTSPGGGNGLMPWSVLEEDKNNATPGDTIVLKYDADVNGNGNGNNNANGSGNFGPIRVDGNGSNVYETTVKYGSETTLCVASATNCDGASVVRTETGNMVGGTRDGVDYRMEHTSASCDTWSEAVIVNADGSHSIDPACNPWRGGNDESLRFVIVPVIEESCNGNCDVTIVEFVLFFLEGFGEAGCGQGNDCEIEGRYISSNTNYGALMGVYDPNTFAHFVRLVK